MIGRCEWRISEVRDVIGPRKSRRPEVGVTSSQHEVTTLQPTSACTHSTIHVVATILIVPKFVADGTENGSSGAAKPGAEG